MSFHPSQNALPSYHDLYITTAEIHRTRLFDLPYGLMVTCTRVGGWELWQSQSFAEKKLIAGEYDTHGLVLDVDGTVIVDSLLEGASS